jgi:hypothetical protein
MENHPSSNEAIMRFFLNPISPLFDHDFACIYYALIILVIRYLHHQTVLSVTNSRAKVD